MEKQCKQCGQMKEESRFGVKAFKTGRHDVCGVCFGLRSSRGGFKFRRISEFTLRQGVIYVAQSANGGNVKIGFTTNLKTRLIALRTQHGRDLQIIATRSGNMLDEASTQLSLIDHHQRGDWFSAVKEVGELISSPEWTVHNPLIIERKAFMTTKEIPQDLIGKRVRITNPVRTMYEQYGTITGKLDDYMLGEWEVEITGCTPMGFDRNEFEVIPAPDDLSRFILYDAPIEIERAAESLINKRVRVTVDHDITEGIVIRRDKSNVPHEWVIDGSKGHIKIHDWFKLGEFEVIDTAPVDIPVTPIKQPLQRLEELEAENKRLRIELDCEKQMVTDKCAVVEHLNSILINILLELDIATGWLTTTYDENEAAIVEAIRAFTRPESAA